MNQNAEPNPSTPDLADVRRANTAGLIGMLIALVGLALDWWVPFASSLCPIGLIVCLYALRRPPRGLAILGVLAGAAGTAVLIWRIVVLTTGTQVGTTTGLATPDVEASYRAANRAIQAYYDENGELPSAEQAQQLFQQAGVSAEGMTPRYAPETDITFSIILPGEDGEIGTNDDVRRESHIGHEPSEPTDLETIDEDEGTGG
jgi:hypothetical protein